MAEATLWLVHAAAYGVMGLRTLLTPIVKVKKYLPLNPVAGMVRHQQMTLARCPLLPNHFQLGQEDRDQLGMQSATVNARPQNLRMGHSPKDAPGRYIFVGFSTHSD